MTYSANLFYVLGCQLSEKYDGLKQFLEKVDSGRTLEMMRLALGENGDFFVAAPKIGRCERLQNTHLKEEIKKAIDQRHLITNLSLGRKGSYVFTTNIGSASWALRPHYPRLHAIMEQWKQTKHPSRIRVSMNPNVEAIKLCCGS